MLRECAGVEADANVPARVQVVDERDRSLRGEGRVDQPHALVESGEGSQGSVGVAVVVLVVHRLDDERACDAGRTRRRMQLVERDRARQLGRRLHGPWVRSPAIGPYLQRPETVGWRRPNQRAFEAEHAGWGLRMHTCTALSMTGVEAAAVMRKLRDRASATAERRSRIPCRK